MSSRSTVSIIIIGDEILKGQTMDTNSHFLCQELYQCGVKVSRVSVIPDDVDIIAEEIRRNSENCSFVFTSGGIGPTHDDVTYDGIAKAFNERMVLNRDLQKVIMNLCIKMGFEEMAAFKMSHVPESSQIHHIRTPNKKISFPVISVRNVFAFSGIPSYLEYAFKQLKSLFCDNSAKYFCKCLYVNILEFEIMTVLNCAVIEFKDIVKFGSYPDVENNYYQVKLTIEADSEEAIKEAEAFLRSHLPHNCIVGRYPPNSTQALRMLESIFYKGAVYYDNSFANAVQASLEVLKDCLFDHEFDEICVSFNGGKDCTALLHLVYMFILKFFPNKTAKLRVLYVRSKQPFSEIEDFIDLCVQRYQLNLITYKGSIKDALNLLKTDHPKIRTILLGTRCTDPHCSDLKTFQMTDSDWPQYMRVSPLLPWSYQYVWKFLRFLEVPYCSLYDRGYTSLGCRENTVPNAELLTSTKDGNDSFYLPAYLLKESEQERNGRVAKKT